MQKNANQLFELLYKDEIKVNISEIIPIDNIKQAQHKMENRLTTGSIVLSF
jgi:D-arabinose 1-dehydrogenase-like Zn-dependent alcohol dehydrogenase